MLDLKIELTLDQRDALDRVCGEMEARAAFSRDWRGYHQRLRVIYGTESDWDSSQALRRDESTLIQVLAAAWAEASDSDE